MDYKDFFKKKMKDWGIDDITDLDNEKKDNFFEEVKREWQEKKSTAGPYCRIQVGTQYVKFTGITGRRGQYALTNNLDEAEFFHKTKDKRLIKMLMRRYPDASLI